MASIIKIRKNDTAGVVPSSLQEGELAVNLKDRILYTANSTAVFELARNTANNGLVVSDPGGNTITIVAPSGVDGSYTLTLPENDGDSGQILQTDGSGNLSWTEAGTLQDADGDTKIQVEEGSDDDTIRFDVGDAPSGYGAVADIMTIASDEFNVSMGTATGSSTDGADVNITSGKGGADGDGGEVTITAGEGGATSGAGGDLNLTGGAADGEGDGGAVVITAGAAATDGTGGGITLETTNGQGDNNGGDFEVETGNGDGDSRGGDVTFDLGNASGDGDGGDFEVDAGNASGTGDGGHVEIDAGDASSGEGGFVKLRAGDSTSGTGGLAQVSSGSSTSGSAGNVEITGGDGAVLAGDVLVTAGSGQSGSNANGANIVLTPGAGDGTGDDGVVKIVGPTSGTSGALRLEDNTGGEYIELTAPATIGSSFSLTLPTTDSTGTQALVSDGSGNLSWADQASNSTITIAAGTGLTGDSSFGLNQTTNATITLNAVGANGIISDADSMQVQGANGVLVTTAGVNVKAADATVTVTSAGVAVNASQVDHDSLLNFVANEHVDHSSVSILGGAGLTGGGDITASRTLAVGAANGIIVDADSIQVESANGVLVTSDGVNVQAANATIVVTSAGVGVGVVTTDLLSGDFVGTVTQGEGITVTNGSGTDADATIALKNAAALSDNTISKWDNSNEQFVNSSITDDGTTVTIGGNLTVNGTTTTIESTTVTVDDSLLKFANGNVADSVDIGFYGQYDEGAGLRYAGLFRDASDATGPNSTNVFKFWTNLTSEPGATFDTAGSGELAQLDAVIDGGTF